MSRISCKVSEKMSYCAINMIIMSPLQMAAQGTQGRGQTDLVNTSFYP